MSELEPTFEPARPEAPETAAPGDNSASESVPDAITVTSSAITAPNGVPASSATAHPAPNTGRRFSSISITKKFLQKTSSALSASSSPSAASSASPSPVPTKTTPSLATKPPSTSNAPRLVTTKLTQTPSPSAKWSKEVSGDNAKSGLSGSDNQSNKSALPSSKVAQANGNRTSPSPGGAVWGPVTASIKANARVQNDFPTAAELKDRADKAAATSAAQRRSLDAFRGVHLDPKAQHWDEMTEEDSDFLTGVIEFGDGKQYTVAPAAEIESADPKPADPSEDRLGNDYDRSWPASRENGTHTNISPSTSFKGSNPPLERVLFNDRHNRMETLPQVRQPPTLLNPTPSGARGPGSRKDSTGRVSRDSPSWNPPPRGGFAAESLDKDSDGRGRLTSVVEKDKVGHNQGGLGPYLRDRSPDGSGRFPGRNIPVMSRRDSQASSAMVGSGPARSNRALSRESSDRGGGVRQLPPHLSVVSPVIPSSATSSIAPRNSWRDSPTAARPPSSALSHARPMSMASDGSHQPPGSENEQLVSPAVSNAVPPSDVDAAALAALVQDEAALKAAMNVAAERARKRRQEEEEQREKERERAKQKLIELEKKMQAEKEAKEKAEREEREKAEKEREQKEEEDRLAKLKSEKERIARERKEQPMSGPGGKERGSNARPVPPQRPSDMVDSWRTARPPLSTNVSSSHANSESKRSPTTILKSRIHDASPTAVQIPNKRPSVDLGGKPALMPEFAALRSKDHDVEVLDFADLHQLAEGYMQPQLETKLITHVNGFETSNKPSAHPDDSKGFTRAEGKYSRSQPPAPLNLVPRGLQDQSQSQGTHSISHGPGSAGLGSARSPRNADPNHSAYRQAPISVLDDTLSRFKIAIEHSNPAHAGMSSDDIMLGLGRASAEVGKGSLNQPPSVHVSLASMSSQEVDKVTTEPAWSQTRVREIEEVDTPSVLIPTLSIRRKPVSNYKAMKHVPAWRWDCLTFDPPVEFMSRRTLSVMDTLVEPSTNSVGRLRIKIPGSSLRSVPYGNSSQRSTSHINSRQRREDLRTNAPPTNAPPMLRPTTNGIITPPKTAPSSNQWPPKSKGAEDAVWRRAVPVTAVPEQTTSVSTLTADASPTPLTSKSVPDDKHNRTLSVPMSSSPARTPPVTVNSIAATTWGRSPLSLTVTDVLPEDPSLKAAWNKASSGMETKATKNSLIDIADEPVPHIPSSISEVRSEDGDAMRTGEKDPSVPARQKYNPHRAFQQVSSQPLVPHNASPVTVPSSLSSTQPTPRSNALALTTNRTPRQTPPSSLPPPLLPIPQSMPPNTSRGSYSQGVPYPSPMLPIASPYTQPMMVPQYAPPTPVMAPLTPSMMHRSSTPGGQMQGPVQGTPLWGQQPLVGHPTGPPTQMGYMRQMQAPLPPPVQYQPQMVQHPSSQSLQLYMSPQPGMMLPPSPGLSPMPPPGMNKSLPNVQRSNNPNMPGGPMQQTLPVSVPMTFQMPSLPPPQQMGYMMASPLQAPGTPQQQFNPQLRPPQGRGMPLHSSQYPTPAPNGYPRPW